MNTSYGICSIKGNKHHINEDRYLLLGSHASLIQRVGRGEIYAVMDGVGGAPRGLAAASTIAWFMPKQELEKL